MRVVPAAVCACCGACVPAWALKFTHVCMECAWCVDQVFNSASVFTLPTSPCSFIAALFDAPAGEDERRHKGVNLELMAKLWQQQLQNLQRKPQGCRWHPEIISWCATLWAKSHGSYELFRDQGFLQLPSGRTLRRFLSQHALQEGIDGQHMQRVKEDAQQLEGPERMMMLVADEMHISVSGAARAWQELRVSDLVPIVPEPCLLVQQRAP